MKTRFVRIVACTVASGWFLYLHAAQEVEFTAAVPRPGQIITRTSTYAMNLDVVLKFAGDEVGRRHEESVETATKVETVLESNGQTITRLQVRYERVEDTTKVTEEEVTQEEPAARSPVLGKTYVVSVKNGVPLILDESGRKPFSDELEIVQADYEGLGQPDPLAEFFKNKKVSLGEEIPMPVGLAGELYSDSRRSKVRFERFTQVLKTVRQETGIRAAVFDTFLKMVGFYEGNVTMKVDLKGETVVGIQNSWPISSRLQGAVRVTGLDQIENRLVMVDGIGSMTLTELVRYGK